MLQLKDLELWHQHIGHSSARAIIETRKCTEGIPELPTNTPFFICAYCEKAKMVKNSGDRSKDEDVDSTWASDRKHRRSVGGIVMMLAGAAIYYRTRLQPTVAQSSTEAEFTNMADAGQAALYLKWILEELVIIMTEPTPIHADN